MAQKLNRLTILTLAVFVLVGAALEAPPALQKAIPQSQSAVYYVCPHHPAIRSAHVGRCPQCHQQLELVRQENGVTVGAGAHHDHRPKHGGMLGMVGDYHLELVETPTDFLVYVYDAFTQPVSTAHLSGAIILTEHIEPTLSPVRLSLLADRAHQCLMATKPTATLTASEATVVIALGGETLDMTFPRPRRVLQQSSSTPQPEM